MTTTITPPTVSPVTVDVPASIFRSTLDLQPFTYRSGMTYTALLESMRTWLRNTLVPYLNTNFQDVTDSWLTNVTAIDQAVDDALAAQATAINTALTTQQQQVADELASTLQQITSGESAALNDAAVFNALQVANSQSLALLDGRYTPAAVGIAFTAMQLAGAGIDPTGAADSTAAVQAFLNAVPNGATVYVPSGAVLKLSATVTITKVMRLTGSGELRWVGASAPVLNPKVDGIVLDGLYITNPNLAAATGIYFEANIGRVNGCRVTQMQDGIQVAPDGEWHDIVISNNLVLDIIGSGTGFINGQWGTGESNGDGIVSWGAAVVITGNRVTAMAGKDARIGIHMENLANRETTSYADADSVGVISGNIISGPFRRGITTEGVQHVAITGNVVSGTTWWGINAVGLAHYSTINGNSIKWKSNTVAAGYQHVGILVYCIQEAMKALTISNNTIHAIPGSIIDYGILFNYDVSVQSNIAYRCKIIGNSIEDESNTLGDGIHISAPSDGMEITENRVYRFGAVGVFAMQGVRITVSNNRLYGRGTASGVTGVQLIGGAAEASVDHNTIRDVETGIQAYFRTETLSCSGNKIRNATTGINYYAAQAPLALTEVGNLFYTVGSARSGLPSGAGFTVVSASNTA